MVMQDDMFLKLRIENEMALKMEDTFSVLWRVEKLVVNLLYQKIWPSGVCLKGVCLILKMWFLLLLFETVIKIKLYAMTCLPLDGNWISASVWECILNWKETEQSMSGPALQCLCAFLFPNTYTFWPKLSTRVTLFLWFPNLLPSKAVQQLLHCIWFWL